MENYEDNIRHHESAGNEHITTHNQNAQETNEEIGRGYGEDSNQLGNDEFGIQQEIAEKLGEQETSNIRLEQLILKQQIQVWRGLLPDPDSFNKYDKETRDKIIAWNDKQIDSNIKNEEKLVDDFVKGNKSSRTYNIIVYLFAILATCIIYYFSNFNPASFGLLTIPAATVVINLYIDNKKDKDN